jgi:hypothetical protein
MQWLLAAVFLLAVCIVKSYGSNPISWAIRNSSRTPV